MEQAETPSTSRGYYCHSCNNTISIPITVSSTFSFIHAASRILLKITPTGCIYVSKLFDNRLILCEELFAGRTTIDIDF